jgi:hypothetical protein
MIRHPVDIGASSGIRFGGEATAVGMLARAQHIGKLDPFIEGTTEV